MTRRSLLTALGIAPVAAKVAATAKPINAPSHAKIIRSVTITSDVGFTVWQAPIRGSGYSKWVDLTQGIDQDYSVISVNIYGKTTS